MDSIDSNQDLFLTQNTFSRERLLPHSLRATTATRGLQKGIPDKLVMQRTGHRCLQKYQRLETSTKIKISNVFGSKKRSVKRHFELGKTTLNLF